VLEHFSAIDFEALAELDIGFADEPFQQRLPLDQRQLSKIIAIEVKQVEGGRL
jgi:hypothetical protein